VQAVTVSGTQTLTNKTLTAPVLTTPTLTSGGDVVGTTATQTLTNKTISGASNTLSNIASASVTGLDTHTASTAAHGATGAVVGTTNAQTLTNKTLTAPTVSDFTNAQHDHSATNAGGAIGYPYGIFYSATGTACADSTWTLIPFDSNTAFNTNFGSVIGAWGTNNSRLTVPTGQTGLYGVNASVTFPANATGFRRIQLRKNAAGSSTGGTLLGSMGLPTITTSGVTTTVSFSRDIYLTAADYVEVFGLQNSGGSLTTSTGESNTSFSINRVG